MHNAGPRQVLGRVELVDAEREAARIGSKIRDEFAQMVIERRTGRIDLSVKQISQPLLGHNDTYWLLIAINLLLQ